MLLDRVVDESPGQIALGNAALCPVDDLRCQDAPDAEFFADPQQQDVDARRIDIGQFCKIPDTHHHFSIDVSAPYIHVLFQALGKPEPDRRENRIDP